MDQSKITTSQFFLQPIYRQQDPKEPATQVISGYRLQNTMIIAVDDLTKTGAVIDAAFRAGANQFQGLRFGLKDDKAIRDELLKMAVLDGKRKAGIIADALGVSLGKLASVVETARNNPVYTGDAATLKQDAAGTPVGAGSMTVSVNVALSYEL
ncbi:MAG: outer membrane protein, 28Kda [Firmicutes bacterium]|nr:outer membrane protein, 28Kda [Bacillota bacterium]